MSTPALSPVLPSEEDFLAALPAVTTPEEMRAWDAGAIALGVPGIVLMENAAQSARSVLCHVLHRFGPNCLAGLDIALLMGAGNNGGDAACLSRQLQDLGASVTLYHAKPLDTAKGDAAFYLHLAQNCQVPCRPMEDYQGGADVLVDGLLGTGFAGSLRDPLVSFIDRCNARPAGCTLALDIPSGLDSMTGHPCPTAIRADATVTFAAAKPGLLYPWARSWTGRVHATYIGTPKAAADRVGASFRELCPAALRLLPGPAPLGYKNAYGHILVVGGAGGLGGAAHLAALSALRSGAGLVTVACPGHETATVKGACPEIMTLALGSGQESDWHTDQVSALADLLPRMRALVVGPGMGRTDAAARFLHTLLQTKRSCPMVLDADALTLLGRNPDWFGLLHRDDVLTPHLGEALTLLGEADFDMRNRRHEAARLLADRAGCTVVLKGPGTLVARTGSPLLLFGQDVPTLSVPGSGDCLTGVVASLLARGCASLVAAGLGVLWHAAAGAQLAEHYPARGNLASEIAGMLPRAAGQTRTSRTSC